MIDLSIPLVCLALNIYHESRADPLKGQLAVALVTLNRAHHKKEKICEVVFKEHQFSWTNLSEWEPRDAKAWAKSLKIARSSFKVEDFTQGATHFHAYYVSPKWAVRMDYVGRWGNHLFYKRKRLTSP